MAADPRGAAVAARPAPRRRFELRRSPRCWDARARTGLMAVCLFALFAASSGLGDEGHVSLQGDMPRYVMNGVFVRDAIRDGAVFRPLSLLDYAQHYYAQYPALSLGHHPPLVPVLEAPVYAIFGISIRSARLVEIAAFVVAVGLLFAIVLTLYDWVAATIASALFATSPFVVLLARSVLSEVPALALGLAALFFLLRFCTAGRRADLVLFVAAASLSLYAKQLAVFLFPTYLATAWLSLGTRRLFRADILVAAAAVLLLTSPLVPMTLELSPMNVAVTLGPRVHAAALSVIAMARVALRSQFTRFVVVLAALGAVRGVVRLDTRALLLLVWAVTVFFAMRAAAPWEPDRYGVYMVPAICALAGSLATEWRARGIAAVMIAVLCLSVALQARAGLQRDVAGAGGYEQAAKFVVASDPGPTVLFSGDVDSGYFTFFVRKHDPQRRLVVLRADKILTTSMMSHVAVADRIHSPAEIYDRLREFGTRYVVVEDRRSEARVLEWLRSELRTPNFAERLRIPFTSSDPRLRGKDIVVYEYLGHTPPDPAAVISIGVPLVGRSVNVPLADLIGSETARSR